MSDFLVAIGLVLVIEGIVYAAFPGLLRRMLEMMEQSPEQTVRFAGLASAVLGITIVWLVRG
ncbi:MAG: DUF2065 domain-containing protein [Flavobacteriaceae bacterium]